MVRSHRPDVASGVLLTALVGGTPLAAQAGTIRGTVTDSAGPRCPTPR